MSERIPLNDDTISPQSTAIIFKQLYIKKKKQDSIVVSTICDEITQYKLQPLWFCNSNDMLLISHGNVNLPFDITTSQSWLWDHSVTISMKAICIMTHVYIPNVIMLHLVIIILDMKRHQSLQPYLLCVNKWLTECIIIGVKFTVVNVRWY